MNRWQSVVCAVGIFAFVLVLVVLAAPGCDIYNGGAMQIESARVEWDSHGCDEHTGLVKLCGVHISLGDRPGVDKRTWYAPVTCEAIESQ